MVIDTNGQGLVGRVTFIQQWCSAIVTIELIVLLLWVVSKAYRSIVSGKKADKGRLDETPSEKASEFGDEYGVPEHIVLVNAAPLRPKGVRHHSNASQPAHFDSDTCHGSYIMLHKPTADEERMETGDYPHADHMHDRRRLWEFRCQFNFRHKVEGDIYFGCEQDKYVPVSAVERYLGSTVTSMLRRAAKGMYQSHGDDPASTEGECERPGIVFPLWVMDQLIVTPDGDDVPSLVDPDFHTFGMTKSHDRKAMRVQMDNLQMSPGQTYTFSFWCIGQFIDAIHWKAPSRGLIPETRLNEVGTNPPCYFVMYAFKPKDQWRSVQGSHDNRHLDSRKNYLLRAGFWSSLLPPSPQREKELMAKDHDYQEKLVGQGSLRRAARSGCFCGMDFMKPKLL